MAAAEAAGGRSGGRPAARARAGWSGGPHRLSGASLVADLVVGWRFLRAETVLFATTVQAAVAEYGLGALTALSPLLVASLALGSTDAPTAYGLFEMAMGVGLVGGGVVLGGLATRIPKGPSIIAAFTALGVALLALSVTESLPLALVLAGVVGLANVTFVVPSQTLFQQRTPDEMLGRVVAIRLAMVNGVLAVAMATSGALAQLIGLRPVLAACGILTAGRGPRRSPGPPDPPRVAARGRRRRTLGARQRNASAKLPDSGAPKSVAVAGGSYPPATHPRHQRCSYRWAGPAAPSTGVARGHVGSR